MAKKKTIPKKEVKKGKGKPATKPKKDKPDPRKTYSDKLADDICSLIATSELGLRRIIDQHPELPAVSTIMAWLADGEHPYFVEQYARAKELQADFIVDQAIEIADDTTKNDVAFTGINHVQRDKMRVDIRKWKAARLAPKKWGDRVDLTSDGEKMQNHVIIQMPDNNRDH